VANLPNELRRRSAKLVGEKQPGRRPLGGIAPRRSRTDHRALDRLSVEFREVLVLRELEDFSYKEIAAIADIPMRTVMSRLARARKRWAPSSQSQSQPCPTFNIGLVSLNKNLRYLFAMS